MRGGSAQTLANARTRRGDVRYPRVQVVQRAVHRARRGVQRGCIAEERALLVADGGRQPRGAPRDGFAAFEQRVLGVEESREDRGGRREGFVDAAAAERAVRGGADGRRERLDDGFEVRVHGEFVATLRGLGGSGSEVTFRIFPQRRHPAVARGRDRVSLGTHREHRRRRGRFRHLLRRPRGSFRASPRTLPAATLSALGATVLSEGHVKSLFTTRSKVGRK